MLMLEGESKRQHINDNNGAISSIYLRQSRRRGQRQLSKESHGTMLNLQLPDLCTLGVASFPCRSYFAQKLSTHQASISIKTRPQAATKPSDVASREAKTLQMYVFVRLNTATTSSCICYVRSGTPLPLAARKADRCCHHRMDVACCLPPVSRASFAGAA